MPSLAVIGTRGYPSYYGGFETAIRKLAPFLADQGWDVTVYGRRDTTVTGRGDSDPRVTSRDTIGLETRRLSTLSYGLTSSLDAAWKRFDAALVMNVANGYFLPLLKSRGVPTLVNVDGIEWERSKWSPTAQRVFKGGAKFTARWADGLVFDSRAIEDYWADNFSAHGIFIPYGGDSSPLLPVPSGLTHRGYVLLVARFVPENSVDEFFHAVPAIAQDHKVVIVGSSGYGGELDEAAKCLAAEHPSVTWLGHLSNDSLLLALWQHAGTYFHGHSVGGTNPALVQAMAVGAPILARDTIYNREVLDGAGMFVPADRYAIAREIDELMSSPEKQEAASRACILRAREHYSWPQVCSSYQSALEAII